MKNGVFKRFANSLMLAVMLVALLFNSTGCLFTFDPAKNVAFISDWAIQAEDDYFLFFFSFEDKDNERIAASADVNLSIDNENGEKVYESTVSINENDFSIWTNQTDGDRLLASIKIKYDDIKQGTSSVGTLTAYVHNDDYFTFEDITVKIRSGLPTIPAVLSLDHDLPQELYDYPNCYVNITEVNYAATENDMYIYLTGIVKGEYSSHIIYWKLFDEEGFAIDWGTVYISGLSHGEKFRDQEIYVYDKIKPGENYILELSTHS